MVGCDWGMWGTQKYLTMYFFFFFLKSWDVTENDAERVLMNKPWGFDNKGTLIVEKQEYDSWLRTPLFN